ncbi:MAG: hypothetical protein KGM15_09890 [Pseudomonadota bacterium]|nr:hypothetical protein [Pseudomonadota bacterium]
MRLALLGLALLGLCATARADSPYTGPAEQRFSPYVGNVGKCDDAGVLARIQGVFRTTQNAYWKEDLQIAGFDRVREISLRGNGTEYIPRRYCIARGHLSDDSVHTVIYDIEESQGIIGFGDGVEWCVVGLDRMFAFSPACSSLRPYAERSLGSKALVERY